jgi:hypothetical protein
MLGDEQEEEEEEEEEEKRDGNAQLTCKICLTECVFQATPSVWLEGEEPSPEVLKVLYIVTLYVTYTRALAYEIGPLCSE